MQTSFYACYDKKSTSREKISVSDIEQGDTVTITFGALNSVKSVTLCESDNNGGSFGGMQGNAAQGTPLDMQSGNSENSANQNTEKVPKAE